MRSFFLALIRKTELLIGEIFAFLSTATGKLAAKFLYHAQWGYEQPEWFDHRLHMLNPKDWFNDFWTASADNVLRVLPLRGKLLDLCSGDGFYDYWFYRKRAGEIMCVEFNREVYDFAVKRHSHEKIKQVLANVLTYELPAFYFDVVCIRGAIEHFSPEDQVRIFKKSFDALKPGGYFCGDTPAKKEGMEKQLPSHEHEWSDEQEMKRALARVFTDLETWTIYSEDRTTLFWRCRK
jgi:SAM-dependent methyltransferase